MVLKEIKTINMQNHKEVVLKLPPTGLIVLTGENSNGKSVIVKATRAMIRGEINKPKKRASLINRDSTFGEIMYTRDDGCQLCMHLEREAARCYISYMYPGKNKVTRYIADRSYKELISVFGFHYDSNSDITLNIGEADDMLLFYKTSNKANGSIMHTALIDSIADNSKETLTNTLTETRKFKEQCTTNYNAYKQATTGLQTYDEEKLETDIATLERYLRNLSLINFPELPKIKVVPKVKLITLYPVDIPKIKIPKLYNLNCNVPNMSTTIYELNELKNKRCPTCGRAFTEHSSAC